ALVHLLAECIGGGLVIPLEAIKDFLDALENAKDLADLQADCNKKAKSKHKSPNAKKKKIKAATAIDPNDKAGPNGDGSVSGWINTSGLLSYSVAFENQ